MFRSETIIEGLIAGLLGVGIAALITIPVNILVQLFGKIELGASIPPISAVLLVLLSVALNVIAGNRPSRIAAQKDPVESLRTE